MVGNDIFGPFFTRGNIVVLRLMVPLKPFVPLIVIVKAAEVPLTRARLEGFALMAKSGFPVPKTVTIVDRVLMIVTVFGTGTPDFAISANPSSLALVKGSSAAFTITINGTNDFNGTTRLSTTIFPLVKNGPKISLPTMVGQYSNSTLTVSTTRSTPVGTYMITVTATSGSITHELTIMVTVTH